MEREKRLKKYKKGGALFLTNKLMHA